MFIPHSRISAQVAGKFLKKLVIGNFGNEGLSPTLESGEHPRRNFWGARKVSSFQEDAHDVTVKSWFLSHLYNGLCRYRKAGVHKVGDLLTYRNLHQRESSTAQIAKITGDYATMENGDEIYLPKIQPAQS